MPDQTPTLAAALVQLQAALPHVTKDAEAQKIIQWAESEAK